MLAHFACLAHAGCISSTHAIIASPLGDARWRRKMLMPPGSPDVIRHADRSEALDERATRNIEGEAAQMPSMLKLPYYFPTESDDGI